MILEIILGIETALLLLLSYITFRSVRVAVNYDELFQQLADDIETNLKHFSVMSGSSLLSNEPEVQQAHSNMMVMARRLNEFILRMQELTGLDLRPPKKPNRPVVR